MENEFRLKVQTAIKCASDMKISGQDNWEDGITDWFDDLFELAVDQLVAETMRTNEIDHQEDE